MPKTRILAVLGVGIVQGSNLTLNIAVFLHWVRDVVLCRWKDCDRWHARGEATGQISSREGLSGIKSHLSLHADYFIASIEIPEGEPFRLKCQVSIAGANNGSCDSHSAEHIRASGDG